MSTAIELWQQALGGLMHLAEIWRYPVKSMLGELLEAAVVGPGGVEGDRRWAVVDAESGVSLSAKRYPDLLSCRAWADEGVIRVGLPDGSEHAVDAPEVAESLSSLLDRRVVLRSADVTNTVRHEFPENPAEGAGPPTVRETNLDGFFDSVPLHLLTTSTVAELQRRLPDAAIDRTRFRPNFLVHTEDQGFIDNEWPGADLRIGSLECRVIDDTRRCIMVSLAQGDLPRDMNIVRTVIKENAARAGIALATKATATVRCGDEVRVSARQA